MTMFIQKQLKIPKVKDGGLLISVSDIIESLTTVFNEEDMVKIEYSFSDEAVVITFDTKTAIDRAEDNL